MKLSRKIEQTRIYKGSEVRSVWTPLKNYKDVRPVTQVHGVCFNEIGEVLIISSDNEWHLPGGTPKKNEQPEETLVREVAEEASVTLKDHKLIGCLEIFYPNNPKKEEGSHFYQLRFAAIIDKINELQIDPATGILFKRKFIAPSEFESYVKWGAVGKEMIKVACDYFKNWKKAGKL